MDKMNRIQLARWGENIAREYLIAQGIAILQMNFRSKLGEIDIVGKENEDVVFFEVKTRSSKNFGYPEEAVNQKKINKIEVVANDFLDFNKLSDANWRIDTVAIIRNPFNGNFEIEWFKDVGS